MQFKLQKNLKKLTNSGPKVPPWIHQEDELCPIGPAIELKKINLPM